MLYFHRELCHDYSCIMLLKQCLFAGLHCSSKHSESNVKEEDVEFVRKQCDLFLVTLRRLNAYVFFKIRSGVTSNQTIASNRTHRRRNRDNGFPALFSFCVLC
jgi:hypothetical protein